MAQSVNLWGATYSDVPALDVPKTGGGTARFTDTTPTTAVESDVASGKIFIKADGSQAVGTASGGGGGGYVTQDAQGYIVLPSTGGGGGGATQHTIHLEFSDSTDTDIDVYYDDSLLGTMITAYEPSTWTYSSKTVTLAQLDGTTWYDKQSIPIGVELIDFTAVTNGYLVDEDTGELVVSEWSSCSDFTLIDPAMTFSYVGYRWYNIIFFTESKQYISKLYMDSDKDSLVGDYAHGTLTPAKFPSTAKYIRIDTYPVNPSTTEMSLIRTA